MEVLMTDQAQASNTPAPSQPSRAAVRIQTLRIKMGLDPEPDGKPSYIWLERWDALIVAFFLAVGVPLLGASGFAPLTKWIVAAVWFAVWAPFFAYFEGRELVGQMMGRGAIKQEQLSEQQNSAQDPFYGVYVAVFVWVAVYAVHVTIAVYPQYNGSMLRLIFQLIPIQIYLSWSSSWISFGTVEIFILAQGWLGTKYINYIMYNTGNTFSKSAPMGERTERHG